MENDEKQAFDWLFLPDGGDTTSLWDSLHDGDLIAISSNLLERTMRLEFDVPHLREFHKLADNLRFVLLLQGVQSARIDRWAVWPGGCSIPYGTPYEEQNRLVAEYQSKWRNESMSWIEFENELAAGKFEVLVLDATLATRNDREFALQMGIRLRTDDTYHEIALRSEGLQVLRSDGIDFNLECLLQIGASYWEAYANHQLGN